jgi:hypothetical protein
VRINITETFDAPVEAIFDALTDIRSLDQRLTSITACDVLTDGPIGKGTRFRETRVLFGKEATEELEFTHFDAPRSFLLEARSRGMHYLTHYTFETTTIGTRLTLTFEGRPETILARLFAFMGLLFRGATEKAFRTDLDELKTTVQVKRLSAPAA